MKRTWELAVNQLCVALSSDFPDLEVASSNVYDGETLVHEDLSNRSTGFIDLLELSRDDLRPSLFDYQQDLVNQIHSNHHKRALLTLPTGAGKTRTAVSAVLEGIGTGKLAKVIWLAPSIELVDQAFRTFADLWIQQGNISTINIIRSLDHITKVQEPLIVLTTPQTIYASRKRRKYTSKWDMIIFDEAHQLGAPSFREAINILGVDNSTRSTETTDDPILLGLSATPGRVNPDETEDLVTMFNRTLLKSKTLGTDPIATLQRRGVLAKLEFKSLTKSSVPTDDEARRLKIAARACDQIVKLGRRPLVFTGTVPGAIVLAEALNSKDVRSHAVHSETPEMLRRQVLSNFESGYISVLTNCQLLATGYDCPAVTDVLLLSPIGSPILFEQVVGRAARGPKTGGARVARVWEFDDHLTMHGRPSSYYRYKDFDWR